MPCGLSIFDFCGFSIFDSRFWGPQGSDTTDDFGVNENAVWFVQNSTYSVWLWADGDDPNAKIFGMGKDSEIVKAVKVTGGTNTLADLGWEPQMLLIKGPGSHWCWFDNIRGTGATTEINMYDPGYKGVAVMTDDESIESPNYNVGFNIKGFYNNEFSSDMWCLAIRRPDAKVENFSIPI